VLAISGDNATSNNTQTTALAKMDNSFEEVHRVRCFNHTLQLSSKALLKPFNVGILGEPGDEPIDGEEDNMPLLEDVDGEDETQSDADGTDEFEDDTGTEDDGIDELEALTEQERSRLLAETAAVRTMVTKVCFVSMLLREGSSVPDCYISRFVGFPSRLFIRQQLLFRRGARRVSSVDSSPN
jgi:hypothetical protein